MNPATKTFVRTFQGAILPGYVACVSNTINNNSITNNGLYTLKNPLLINNLVVDSTLTNTQHYLAYTNKIKISYHIITAGVNNWYSDPGYGDFDGTIEYTAETGDFVTINFLGTGFKCLVWADPSYSDAALYTNDTVADISNGIATPDGTVSLTNFAGWGSVVRDVVSGLPFGWHTVSIQYTETLPCWFEFDAVVLDHAVGPVKNTNISSKGALASDINVPVMAFKCVDVMDHLIDNISIANLGTMQDTADISAVKLYEDVNGNYNYDGGDNFIANYNSYAGGKWNFTSLNLSSGKNLIVTIDIDGSTVNYGRTFRGAISAGDVGCTNGLVNNNIITNNGTITLGGPPIVGPIIPSSTQVTNNNTQTLSFTTTITEKGGGIGNINIDLSSIAGPAAHPLTNSAGITYECSEITIPFSVFPTNYTLVLKAYENGNSVYSSNTISIAILPVIPPNIGDIIPSSAQVTNNNSQELSFTTTITDKGSGRGNAYMDLSSIGGSTNYPLTNTAGNNYQGSNITIPSTVLPGNYTFILKAYESGNNVYSTNTTSITVISVEPPTIGAITPAPASISNNNIQKLSFTTTITDKGGGIGNVRIDLSQIGNSSNQMLYNTAIASNVYTYKVSNITVPLFWPLGNYDLPLRAYNSGNSDYNTNTVPITVIGVIIVNIAPIADAGPGKTNQAGSTVTLYGTNSSDPDNDTLTYTWSIESGWDSPIDITPNNSAAASKATFTAPDVEEETKLVIKLIVNDGTVDSDPDYVTNTIKPFEKNLKNAYIYPNPIIGCEPFTLAALTKGKISIQIYDLLGHLVWENEFESSDNNGEIKYGNGMCDIGKKLASGIYIVFIKDENDSAPKKLKLIYKK